MVPIGFTTGLLFKLPLPFEERVKLMHSIGTEAIELSFATPKELFDCRPSVEIQALMKNFRYVTIHAPWKNVGYGRGIKTERILIHLRYLCQKFPVKGIVVHPDTVFDFQKLEKSGLPILLENVGRKKFGADTEVFRTIRDRFNFGFVLDIEHAYDNDPTMKLAEEFYGVMGDRLRHMHVSGHRGSEMHVPVFLSDNRETVAEFLEEHSKHPIILEGIISKDVQERLRDELNFVRKASR
ncbi:MAG: hypothetical protein JW727_03415 [Candidatus Aenigmarchaeota archaeon]|nr:hypothetical protein [Candidatus Aenigmarchaeota archaeon]